MNTKLKIGEKYCCIDTFGMMSKMMTYLGVGYIYQTYNGKTFYKGHIKKYVFQSDKKENGYYRFAIAEPVFNDNFEWSGNMQVVQYGNDLEHIFYKFRQDYFTISEEHSLEPKDFPKPYSKELQNSSSDGSFV